VTTLLREPEVRANLLGRYEEMYHHLPALQVLHIGTFENKYGPRRSIVFHRGRSINETADERDITADKGAKMIKGSFLGSEITAEVLIQTDNYDNLIWLKPRTTLSAPIKCLLWTLCTGHSYKKLEPHLHSLRHTLQCLTITVPRPEPHHQIDFSQFRLTHVTLPLGLVVPDTGDRRAWNWTLSMNLPTSLQQLYLEDVGGGFYHFTSKESSRRKRTVLTYLFRRLNLEFFPNLRQLWLFRFSIMDEHAELQSVTLNGVLKALAEAELDFCPLPVWGMPKEEQLRQSKHRFGRLVIGYAVLPGSHHAGEPLEAKDITQLSQDRRLLFVRTGLKCSSESCEKWKAHRAWIQAERRKMALWEDIKPLIWPPLQLADISIT